MRWLAVAVVGVVFKELAGLFALDAREQGGFYE